MTKQEVLDSIRYFSPKFPREALQEIQANRDEYIPELLESLDYAFQNAERMYEDYDDESDNDYFMHIYAMYLLAEFREKRAFPYLIKLMHLPEKHADFIFGDTLTDGLPKILLCTYDGENLQMLADIIEDPEMCEWSRSAALGAYTFLCTEGYVRRDDFISYLRSLIYDKLRDEESEIVNTGFLHCIADAHIIEMTRDALFLHDQNKITVRMYGDYDGFLDWVFFEDLNEKKSPYIANAIKSIGWWACFEKDEKDEKKSKETSLEDSFSDFIADGMKKDREAELNLSKSGKKPGRNDPCPCGSGKKYKKCCIDKDNAVTEIPESSILRIEDKYDLLEMYPTDSELFNEIYEKEAIEIDKLVYKALHHRAIPIWVKRDMHREEIGKIDYLNEALKLFSEKCERENIASFSEYDEKYMIHYRSGDWVAELIEMADSENLSRMAAIGDAARNIFEKFEDCEK